MTTILNKYNFYVNSRERISGDVNNFTVQLKTPLLLTSNKSRFEIYLNSIEYPYNFYQVNSTNNSFGLDVYIYSVFSAHHTVYITHGNYNIISLLDEIKTQVLTTALLPSVDFVGTYNKTNGKATFSTTSAIYSFGLLFSGTTIGRMVGFTSDVLVSNLSAVVGNQNVNVNPITYICLRADIITSNKDQEALASTGENSDILCKVPIRTPPGTYIYYKMDFDDRIQLTTEIISTINIRITPGNQTDTIDNNGLNFTFGLTIIEVLVPDAVGYNKIDMIGGPDVNAMADDLKQQQEALINELLQYRDELAKDTDTRKADA